MDIKYFETGGIPCKAYLSDTGETELAILTVHGFAGSKESSTIQALAQAICPEDAAVYCFDFPAHGDHPAEGDALRVTACSEALLSVARHVRGAHDARYGVFATSFGGYMALHCIDQLEEILPGFMLVLKAPAVKMHETLEKRIIGEHITQFEERGFIELGFKRKITVHRDFLDDLEVHDVCVSYNRPMLIIHGTEDDIVTPADIADFIARNPLARLVEVPGADHCFKGDGNIERVIAEARAYIRMPVAVAGSQ